MVCHDLRTPLAAIKEALALLTETATSQLDDRQHRYLAVAREEINRLNRMIDDLVEVSRMESGKVVLHPKAVDLSELLSAATESLSPLAGKRNLTIRRDVPSLLPQVTGDRDQLLRVFGNLLDNAIKHSPVGGTVRVGITPVDPRSGAPAGDGSTARDGYVQVTVSNDGPGIPPEAIDRIFEKFERADSRCPGSGLGLAVVRSIVEMHHGRVWAESTSGQGARFQFTLPIREAS